MATIKKIFYNRKEPCLLINIGEILRSLLEESKISDTYRVIKYEISESGRSITSIVRRLDIKVIIIETSRIKEFSEKTINELITLRTKGIIIYDAEEFYEIKNKRIPIIRLSQKKYLGDDIFSIKMRKRYKYLKRIIDLFFTILMAPFALVLIFLGGILTKLTSKGDVFFSQIRVGEYGETFVIRKIRTMTSSGNDGRFTEQNDSRITPIGKILRLTKIDELPQLWNIFMGEMSLIGPRPERPEYVNEYSKINPFFNLRHMIKPGVTGWAQIHIPRATPADNMKKLEYDLYYIKKYHWILDIKILFETAKIVLTLRSN